MMLTLDIPKKLSEQISRDKRRTGLSKSYIVRQILLQHYGQTPRTQKSAA